MATRRNLTIKRSYLGELLAEQLLKHLNNNGKAKAKLEKFLGRLCQLIASTAWKKVPGTLCLTASSYNQNEHWRSVFSELLREMRQHKFTAFIQPSMDRNWTLSWESRNEYAKQLQTILSLLQLGVLDRLRHCQECENWFFARFNHQIFCSRQCRQKNFRESEKGRSRRREYMRHKMREYRATERKRR